MGRRGRSTSGARSGALRPARPSVDYRFQIEPGEPWAPLERFLPDPAALLDHWLSLPKLTCCSMRGGFFIHADGSLWNERAVDEIKMSVTWLQALGRILRGDDSAWVWAWEESNMTLARRGGVVEMRDVLDDGRVVCPPVAFPLTAFAEALLVPARKFERLAAAVRALLAARREAARDGLPTNLTERFETVEHNLPLCWGDGVREVEAALGQA